MKLVLSGMEDSFYHGRPNGWYDSFTEAARVTPEAFFKNAAVPHNREHLDTKIWVYSAPWNFLVAPDDKTSLLLEQWLKQSHRVLALQRSGKKIEIVNVQSVSLHSVCRALGVVPLPSLEASINKFTEDCSAVTLLKQWAPDIWRTYEALEAVCWFPERAIKDNNENAAISSIINTLSHVQRKAYVFAIGQSELTVIANELTNGLYDNAVETTVPKTDMEKLVTERADDTSSALEQVKQDFSKEKLKTEKLLVSNLTMQKELNDLKINSIKTKHASEALIEENELLLAKLHQVQIELELYYKDKIALESALLESNAMLDRARNVISDIVQNG